MSAKLAIVTGSSKGIGLSIVQCFLQEADWLVLGVSRSSSALLGQNNYSELLCDLLDPSSIKLVTEKIKHMIDEYKPLEVCVVHNFGATCNSHLLQTSLDQWNRIFQANVHIPFLLTREVTPLMPPNSSHLYIGSTLSEIAVPDSCAYVASKHALAGLMKAAAVDLASASIRLNLICPGFTDTDMAEQVLEHGASKAGKPLEEWKASLEQKSPLKRFLHPEEIGKLVVYLAENPAISGQVIHINGGFGLLW